MLDLPQHETEKLLRQRVVELGGIIDQRVELIGLSQDAARLDITVTYGSGKVHEITADYVVGCDGAHSRVRHELGLSFDGQPYDRDWLLADVRMDWRRPEDTVYAFFAGDGTVMSCFPMRDHGWRLVFPYAGNRGRQPPTVEEIQQLADQRAPERIVVSEPSWLANFRSQRRSTNIYRSGRVMLAGDAVHVYSPAGGQGMNIGMLDAHNLAWKLALVASGRSPDWLLETYAEERAPVAAEVLAWTHALVRFGTIRNPLKRAVRDTLTPIISRIAPVHERFVRRLNQQHVAYRTSRLTRHDEGSAPGPGDRAPDVEVMVHGGRTQRLYEVLRGARHVMLVSSTGDLDEVASTELGQFRDMLDVAVGGFDSRAKSRYLIRPDGYIAARDHADQMPSILDYLRCLFGDLEIRHRSASRTGGAAGEVATGSSTGTGYGMMNRFRFVIAE